MLETDVFKYWYDFLNFYIAKSVLFILLKFVESTLNE